MDTSKYSYPSSITANQSVAGQTDPSTPSVRPQSLYGINIPDLPPRIDRQSKPGPGEGLTPSRTNSSGGTIGRSAQERLFGKQNVNDDLQADYISRNALVDSMERTQTSLDRPHRINPVVSSPSGKSSSIPTQQNGSYDSVSSYDSYNTAQLSAQNIGRLGPNAPDDLKSVPNAKYVLSQRIFG